MNVSEKEFKIPTNVVRKKHVLEEDTYLKGMDKIIERDFFPNLKKLRLQNDYADALSINSTEQYKQLRAKYGGSPRPSECASPATFETPTLRHQESKEESVEGSHTEEVETNECQMPKKLSLDQYVETYTTEDSVSFKNLLKQAEEKHKDSYKWMYKDEEIINDISNRFKIPSVKEQSSGISRSAVLDTWTYRNKNSLLFHPEGVELGDAERRDRLAKRRSIVYANTALRESPFDDRHNQQLIKKLAKNQSCISSEGKIGVDGKVISNENGDKEPQRYEYVRSPSPMPGVSETPLMTWGEIDGTPFHLEGGDTPRPNGSANFYIQPVSRREEIAYSLADKASESQRNKKKEAHAATSHSHISPCPNFQSRLSSMSPAARRLASSTIGKRRPTDSVLRQSYTHTPRRTPNTPVRITDNILPVSTPIRSSSGNTTSIPTSTADNLTDNLLCLRTAPRNRAADFFKLSNIME